MRTPRSLSALLATTAFAMAPATQAAPPTHLTLDVDGTFKSRHFSRVCGFPVFERQAGTVRITLYRDRSGAIVRELDTSASFKTFLWSPVEAGGTGGSFSSPNSASAKTDYPDGVYLGAPAVVTYNGLQIRAPGTPEAGHDVYAAEVAFIDDAGVPFIDILGSLDAHGNFTDGPTFDAAVCAGLAAP